MRWKGNRRSKMESAPVKLVDLQVSICPSPLSDAAAEFLRDGRSRFSKIKCFDFVPSNYENAWSILNQLTRGTFCEWGSGLGIVVGLAEYLGYESSGIEIDPELAETSRDFLRQHGLKASITTGSYLEESPVSANYYVYSWPGQIESVERRFLEIAPPDGRLLICYGQDELRCMARSKPVADAASIRDLT